VMLGCFAPGLSEFLASLVLGFLGWDFRVSTFFLFLFSLFSRWSLDGSLFPVGGPVRFKLLLVGTLEGGGAPCCTMSK